MHRIRQQSCSGQASWPSTRSVCSASFTHVALPASSVASSMSAEGVPGNDSQQFVQNREPVGVDLAPKYQDMGRPHPPGRPRRRTLEVPVHDELRPAAASSVIRRVDRRGQGEVDRHRARLHGRRGGRPGSSAGSSARRSQPPMSAPAS